MSVANWHAFVVAALGFAAASTAPAHEVQADLGGIAEKRVMIPMRDGTNLGADLYIPGGRGPWPAIFEQRYRPIEDLETRTGAANLARSGYAVAMVNFRGARLSEGTWVGYRALGWGKLEDGYDTCEWLARQRWCSGKIGTFGPSQAGFAQNFLAVAHPPHLVAQYMVDTGLSLFEEGYRLGGLTNPTRFKLSDAPRNRADNRKLMEAWFHHPDYDGYWRDEDCSLHFGDMNVPCYIIGSWYDYMSAGSIRSFVGRQHLGGPKARGRQQLLLGPWLHAGYPKPSRVREMTYPDNASFDIYAHMIRWFDHYLKGVMNGVEKASPVRYFVMGATGERGAPGNVWRTAQDWPVPVKITPYFLQANLGLSISGPTSAQSATTYLNDPAHPAKSPGMDFSEALDARAFEGQSSVRTFTTEVLTEPVEWTGVVRAELFVSSTARDTDFVVRVSDVYPDGRSILILDFPRRARYREGFDREVLMTPGAICKIAFDIGSLSQIFNRGHRIRVAVASSGIMAQDDPNPQTGAPLAIDPDGSGVAAENTIYHERDHSSRILAPIPQKPGSGPL